MLVELEKYENGLWDRIVIDYDPKKKPIISDAPMPEPSLLERIIIFLICPKRERRR